MTVYAARIVTFVVLPLAAAVAINRFDGSIRTRAQRLEVYLIYLFGLGVAGGGIGGAFGHLFLSDLVAEAVGWGIGSPFQLEMGFANLALGVLGLIAVGRRDGFREATVVAVTAIGVGATIVHLIDIVQTGNLAPGNTLQNIANLAKPLLLIAFLRASGKADSTANLTPIQHHGPAVGWLTAIVSTAFGVGYAIDHVLLATAIGILISVIGVWFFVGQRRGTTSDHPGR